MGTIVFSLCGKMVSGKNQQNIAVRQGGGFRRYPNANFEKWRNTMSKQIWQQRKGLGLKILFDSPVHLEVAYTPGDNIRRDATGILDALFHLLEHANVLADDALVKELHWKENAVNKSNPNLIIAIDTCQH